MRSAILDLLGRAGAYRAAKFCARRVPRLLVYHRFGPRGCDAETFEKQMRLLSREFRVVSVSGLCRILRSGDEIPSNTAVITIDDGYADFRHIAFPILKKYGLPATIYVVSDFVDGKIWLWPDVLTYALKSTRHRDIALLLEGAERRYRLETEEEQHRAWNDIADYCLSLENRAKLRFIEDVVRALDVAIPERPVADYASVSWGDLREMVTAGIEVGSHTCTHPKLTMIQKSELEYEVAASKARIESMLQVQVEGFCYPNGGRADVNEDVKRMVRRCGYLHATVGYHDMNVVEDLFELGRYGAAPDMFNFRKTVYGVDYLRGRFRRI